MSRRKQAKPRSLKRDEEWNDGPEHGTPQDFEDYSSLGIVEREDENGHEDDEEEELRRAFDRHSQDYPQDGGPSSVRDPDLENQNSLDSDAPGTGSSSWHSEDGGRNSRDRGEETPSSCATPTSASFPSEPELDNEIGVNAEGNNPAAPYPCQFCDRTFPRLGYLKKHEQSHGDQMPYRCNWCARLFKHKRSRDRHVKLHTGDRRYRCCHCEAAFSRSDHLKIHMKTHDNQKPYQCTACSRGYNTAAALTSHMQSHKKHARAQSPGQNMKQDTDRDRRSVSLHGASSSSLSSPPPPPPPPPPLPPPSIGNSGSPILNPNPDRKSSLKSSYLNSDNGAPSSIVDSPLKLACIYCTRDSFASMQQLRMHVRAMHRSILNGESSTMARTYDRNDTDVIEDRSKFQDDEKSVERSARDDYETSMEGGEARDYLESGLCCGQCTMKFSNVGSLRDHLATIHRNDGFGDSALTMCGIPCASAAAEYYTAEHCILRRCENRRVSSNDPTRRDSEGTESNGETRDGEPPRVSNDRTLFASESKVVPSSEAADLRKKRTRPGDSSYSAGTLLCGQCGAAFKDFESFREHLARHLQADQRKIRIAPTNPCPRCDANFSEREDMLAHLTKHYLGETSEEYACGACKKFYPHPDLLQRHLLDSHAHNLYRCALCRETFDSRVAIQVHFAVKHSQECRVYRCVACSGSNYENSPGGKTSDEGGSFYFRSEEEMANHVRSLHAPPSTLLNTSPLPKSRTSTPGPSVATPGSCVFCGIRCNSNLELQLHLASHSTSLYRCPVCGEGFPVEFLLDRHITQAHRVNGERIDATENPRTRNGASRLAGEETTRTRKRGTSPSSSNNNSLNQRDNNNKRLNCGTSNGTTITRVAGQLRCELCEHGEFATEAELQAHKKLVHAPVAKLQSKSLTSVSMTCAYCGETCRSRSELESHTRIQHASNEPGGRHKCNICDEVCPSGGILAEHKLRKHCKIRLSDSCVVCRAALANEAQFIEHVQRHSAQDTTDPRQRLDNARTHYLPAGCVVCRQTLVSDLECRLHARHHLRSSDNLPRNLTTSPTPIRHKKQQLQRSAFSCSLCLREFNADYFVGLPSNPSGANVGPPSSLGVCKSCYVRHSQGLPILSSPYEHARPSNNETTLWTAADKDRQADWERSSFWDNDRSYRADGSGIIETTKKDVTAFDVSRCEECGVKFENSDEAERHRIEEHKETNCQNANIYTCIQCQISFPTEDKIQQHVRKEHLESPNKASIEALRCHLCLFEANSPLQLQGHLIEHTFAGYAALTCYMCQALFTTPIALQNHMLQKHGLGARPYDCGNCNLKFFFRIELDHHTAMVHRGTESSSPTVDAELAKATDDRTRIQDEDDRHRSKNVTVKEEIASTLDDEDVNAVEDSHVDRSSYLEAKYERCLTVEAKKESFPVPCAMEEKTLS